MTYARARLIVVACSLLVVPRFASAQGARAVAPRGPAAVVLADRQDGPVGPALRGGAQRRPGGAGPARGARAAMLPDPDSMSAAAVERYFDNYVLFQARTALQLDDAKFLMFGGQLEKMQAARRQHQMRRRQLLDELRVMVRPDGNANVDDTLVNAKLKELDDLLVQAAQDLRTAHQQIDALLGPRQRARFRVFEEQMERQKLDLMAQARQQARPAGQAAAPPVGP